MVEDLVQWFRVQLDEDERTAQATVWDGSDNKLSWELIASATIDVGGDEFYVGDRTIANHMMAHEPARVLREIEADRKLLAQYAEVAVNDVNDVEYAHGWANALGLAVRLRASTFSDRPGYREEWRP